MQVVFTPHSAGSYEAVLQVQAQLVGMERDGSLTSRVILKALAEKPKLEVRGRGEGGGKGGKGKWSVSDKAQLHLQQAV